LLAARIRAEQVNAAQLATIERCQARFEFFEQLFQLFLGHISLFDFIITKNYLRQIYGCVAELVICGATAPVMKGSNCWKKFRRMTEIESCRGWVF
jgi:hypothetical protein